MSDILEVISTRKSIRRYKADLIPEKILGKVLEVARLEDLFSYFVNVASRINSRSE